MACCTGNDKLLVLQGKNGKQGGKNSTLIIQIDSTWHRNSGKLATIIELEQISEGHTRKPHHNASSKTQLSWTCLTKDKREHTAENTRIVGYG